MSFKRLVILSLMGCYLYTLAFGIFMTDLIRLPAPLIFGMPLLLLFKRTDQQFEYYREVCLFAFAMFLYYIIGMSDHIAYTANLITIVICALYFNFFVGLNKRRFVLSVAMFYGLLSVSMAIMVLDHSYQSTIDQIRSIMLDEYIKQSPAGLALTQFTFGYQIAAFTAFIFIAVCVFRQHFLIKAVAICVCLTCIYLGMNRSAFVSFAIAAFAFLLIYYRLKAVIIIAATVLIGFAVYTYVLKDSMDQKNNILAKNEAKEANEYNRADLAAENLKIFSDYPLGLIFYGKNWDEVTYRHPLFTFGLSSHNAYLMFITYLGPFLGIGLLVAVYQKILRLFRRAISDNGLKRNALLICLLFSFFAVSLNALSHNGWLMGGDGPTLFLYFSILQCGKIYVMQHDKKITGHPAEDVKPLLVMHNI